MTKSQISLKPFFTFLFLANGISWFFWIPAARLRHDLMTIPTIALHTLGGFGLAYFTHLLAWAAR